MNIHDIYLLDNYNIRGGITDEDQRARRLARVHCIVVDELNQYNYARFQFLSAIQSMLQLQARVVSGQQALPCMPAWIRPRIDKNNNNNSYIATLPIV